MLDMMIKICSNFKFWNRLLVLALIVCVTAIAIRQGLKPYLSSDVRSILKETHINAGIIMVISAFFHGLGHSGFLLRLKKKKEQKQ